MRMNPKTARRLLLIAAVTTIVVAALVSVFVVRTWQINRRAEAQRAEGLAHFERKEYARALDKLGPYLRVQSHQTDRPALIAYGRSREAIEEGNLRHIRESIGVFRTAFELDPSDREVGLTLLRHYNTVGFGPEARDLAVRLRPANLDETTPRDLEALRGEVTARIAVRAFDATLDRLLARILTLAPDDFGAHLTWISVLRQTDRTAQAADHTRRVVEKFPDDPRFRFLDAVSRVDESSQSGPGVEKFFATACEIAGLDPETAEQRSAVAYTDPVFVARLVGSFDAMFKFPHSLAVLREVSARIADVDLARAFVRRAWQAGHYQEVVDRLSRPDTPTAGMHSELLAFKAMSLCEVARSGELPTIVDTLRHRGEDFRARAWSLALEKFTDTTTEGRLAAIKNLQAAQREDPSEPIFAFYLGEALVALDRTEEAREQWQASIASPLSRGWALPHSRNSATLVGQGRLDEALRAAERSRLIAPGNPATSIAVLGAKLAMIEAGYGIPQDPNALLDQIDQSVAQLERWSDRSAVRGVREVLIPGRALLLAAIGRADDARASIDAELSRNPPVDPGVLAHLSLISAQYKLGKEHACLDLAQRLSPDDPSLALTRALLTHGEGKHEEALRSIQSAADRADQSRAKAWKLAVCRFLDATDPATALKNWIELADANPEDLQVQLAAIGSRSAVSDLEFVDRAGQRAARLSGTDAQRPTITGRVARARAILASKVTGPRRDEAVSLMRSVVAEAPDLTEPRRILVSALLLDDPLQGVKPDYPAALEQLRAIAATSPDRAAAALDIAEVYQRQRDTDRAGEELRRIVGDPSASIAARDRACDMLMAQRDFSAAVTPLKARVESEGSKAPAALLLRYATALRGTRQTDDALAVLRRVANMPMAEADVILQTADGLALCQDRDGARAMIDKLGSVPSKPGVAEWARGRFEARHGDPSGADKLLARATELDRSNVAFWRELILFRANQHDAAKAAEAVEQALAALPGNQDLLVLKEQMALSASVDSGSLASLIEAISKTPGSAARVAAMRAIEDARAAGKLTDVKTLTELSGKFPGDAGLQAVVLRAFLEMKPPRTDLASDLAQRAQASFPGSPTLARLAVVAFRASGDWTRMRSAADAWEQMSGTADAQLALAEAELRSGHAQRAAEVVRPLLGRAQARPDDAASSQVLDLFARSMIEMDREPDAFEVLSPLLDGSDAVCGRVWPGLIASAIKSGATAEKWAKRGLQASGKSGPAVWSEIAGACIDAAQRLPDRKRELLSLAKSRLSGMAEGNDVSALSLARLGLALQLLEEYRDAELTYRKALALDPACSIAMNNLADLAIAGRVKLEEAMALASRGVESTKSRDGAMLFALARLQTAQAEASAAASDGAPDRAGLARALATYASALECLPGEFEIALRAADIHGRLGDQAAALALFERVLRAPNLTPDVRALAENNAAYALLQLNRGPTDLTRAREFARSAVKKVESAAYLDTLGQVELARGDRAEAQSAFRRALAIEPQTGSSLIGLAAALHGGTAAERAEASSVLSKAEAMVKDRPREYTDAEKTAIRELRAKLAQVN